MMMIPPPTTTTRLLSLLFICQVEAQFQGNGVKNGNPFYLRNDLPPGFTNTGRGSETATQKSDRLAGKVPLADPLEAPDPNLGPYDESSGPFMDPLYKAKCFNEPYTPATIDGPELYSDYAKIFDWGFANQMGPPLQSKSLDNNKVTNNRFPSMFLRMCFHDNSIDQMSPPFAEYADNNVVGGRWDGPYRYMETSGGDASVLICPEERYHPNQNYDQTASRILYALQSEQVGITKDITGDPTTTSPTSMVDKYGLSYADLLHNGCVAAVHYLHQDNDPASANAATAASGHFYYGRQDACHIPNLRADYDNAKAAYGYHKRFPLCGPTDLLPGVLLEAEELSYWFTARGMSDCNWLALMWTHTAMDNMAITCPLQKLPATTALADVDELDKFRSTSRIYFNPGDTLDYFSFFLNNGTHYPTDPTLITDFERGNCNWHMDSADGTKGRRYHWPMTRPDCVLAHNAVVRRNKDVTQDLTPLKDAVQAYHQDTVTSTVKTEALLYALNLLSGAPAGADPMLSNVQCAAPDHATYPLLFGSYFGQVQ